MVFVCLRGHVRRYCSGQSNSLSWCSRFWISPILPFLLKKREWPFRILQLQHPFLRHLLAADVLRTLCWRVVCDVKFGFHWNKSGKNVINCIMWLNFFPFQVQGVMGNVVKQLALLYQTCVFKSVYGIWQRGPMCSEPVFSITSCLQALNQWGKL